MMKQIAIYISLLLAIVFCYSCETEIEIDTGEFIPRHVIEGYIENDAYAWVTITNNVPFFGELNLDISSAENAMQLLEDLFVLTATVVVDDGIVFDTLAFMIDPGIMQQKLIWPPVKYQGSKLMGSVGGKYNLTVTIGENVYTSSTTITKPLVPDSMWFVQENDTTFGMVYALVTDDASVANYYQYFVKRLGKDDYFVPGFLSLWDDSFFNGQQFVVNVYRGSLPSYLRDTTYNDEWRKYMIGDTMQMKSVSMDRASYEFWQSHAKTNIRGGALGVWCGFGAHYSEPLVCE